MADPHAVIVTGRTSHTPRRVQPPVLLRDKTTKTACELHAHATEGRAACAASSDVYEFAGPICVLRGTVMQAHQAAPRMWLLRPLKQLEPLRVPVGVGPPRLKGEAHEQLWMRRQRVDGCQRWQRRAALHVALGAGGVPLELVLHCGSE